jgi:signal transduction histidine kinase
VPSVLREHFFEKYKTYGKSSGTGLGTYSAKLLADAMGYGIAMQTSDADNATTITITFPEDQGRTG